MLEYSKEHITIISTKGGRGHNEDNAGHIALPEGELVVVCDGVGGLKAGEVASKIAINTIISSVKNHTSIPIKERIVNAIQSANKKIFAEAHADSSKESMATTVAGIFIPKNLNTFYSFHVGDSRVYQIRNGQIIYQSKDHSYVQQLIDSGQLSEKQALSHPKRNVINRALGINEFAEISLREKQFKKSDTFIVCSDGIHDYLTNKQLTTIINKNGSHLKACKELVDKADYKGSWEKNGSHDNITAAVFSYSYKNWYKKVAVASLLILLPLLAGGFYFMRDDLGFINAIPSNSALVSKDSLSVDTATHNLSTTSLSAEEKDLIKKSPFYKKLYNYFMDKDKKERTLVLDKVKFDSGESELNATSKTYLDTLSIFLKHHDKIHIKIIGHSDNSGPENAKVDISWNRASSVKQYLVDHNKISSDRINTTGVSDFKPINEGNPEDNRKIEIIVNNEIN